jgi:hypothetical protein
MAIFELMGLLKARDSKEVVIVTPADGPMENE